MTDYVSNTPISGPTKLDWKLHWDIGGMGWSWEWGMFYPTSNPPDAPMRAPARPTGGA